MQSNVATYALLLLLNVATVYSVNTEDQVDQGRLQIAGFDQPLSLGQEHENSWDNGALSLVLRTIAERVSQGLQEETNNIERVSEDQAWSLENRLKGIYSYLKHHPALMERRLYVGSRRPNQVPPSLQPETRKRTLSLDIAQPVCPSQTEWRLLYNAKDINDTDVEVFQPTRGTEGQQWFYTVTCNNNAFSTRRCPGCCIGINNVEYSSSCRQKKTYVMALVRKRGQTIYDWNWIQVDTSCNCAITPKSFG